MGVKKEGGRTLEIKKVQAEYFAVSTPGANQSISTRPPFLPVQRVVSPDVHLGSSTA